MYSQGFIEAMRRWQREWLNDDSKRRGFVGTGIFDLKPTKAEEPQQVVESELLRVLEGGENDAI